VRENKQKRTRNRREIPPTTAVPDDKSDDWVIIQQPHWLKLACNRNAGAAENKEKPRLLTAKPQSLTTSLTSRSALVSCSWCSCFSFCGNYILTYHKRV
jgi:hypothetical protein